MKQRPRRAGWSSQERPRPAGKGSDPTLRGPAWGVPGAHRATTMLVHFRETPYGLAMSLVETRPENSKVRHEHLASLGSIETPLSLPPALNSGADCTNGWPSLQGALFVRLCRRPMWISQPMLDD